MLSSKTFKYAPVELGDVEPAHRTLPSLRKPSIYESFVKWTFKTALGIFLLVTMVFGILKIFYLLKAKPTSLSSPSSFYPDYPTILTKFHEEQDFIQWDTVGDEAWNRMIPNGAGYIRVPYPRSYGLEASLPIGFHGNDPEEAEVYQASVIHQLHCLGTLRLVLQAYRSGKILDNEYDSDWHMAHCLNNVRQALICGADSTLDRSIGTLMENGFYTAKFNGLGSFHQCRDWEATKDFLVEHRARDWNKTIGET